MVTAAHERIPEIGLGWRLKIALADAGIKAEDMAAELDVSRQTVTRWMTGNGTPPKRVYIKEWARLTGVSLGWLEHGVGHGAPMPTPPGGDVKQLRRPDNQQLPRLDSNQQPFGYVTELAA